MIVDTTGSQPSRPFGFRLLPFGILAPGDMFHVPDTGKLAKPDNADKAVLIGFSVHNGANDGFINDLRIQKILLNNSPTELWAVCTRCGEPDTTPAS